MIIDGSDFHRDIVLSKNEDITQDSLFSGRLQCLQYKQGYRFSIDAVLLSHFITPKPDDRILDLCAGCGVVSLILAYRWSAIHLTAIEIQPQLAELIRRNIEINHFDGRINAIEGDCRQINELVEAGSFEWVVCNPPYRKSDTGRQNPAEEQAVARHEIKVDLAGVIKAVSFALKTRGRVAFVYPALRIAALVAELKNNGFEPKRLQVIHSYPGGDGKLVLLEAIKGGGEELAILPPFYIYKESDGDYSDEMEKYYQP